MVAEDLAAKKLIRLPVRGMHVELTLWIIALKGPELPAAAREFWNVLRGKRA